MVFLYIIEIDACCCCAFNRLLPDGGSLSSQSLLSPQLAQRAGTWLRKVQVQVQVQVNAFIRRKM